VLIELPHQVGDINRLWVRGGSPESVLASNDGASLDWPGDFIRSYLGRDVPMFAPRMPAAEIDLLFERGGKPEVAIEIKRSSAPTLSRGFHIACKVLKVKESFVVHGSDETCPEADGVTAIGLVELMRRLST
jgi:predicted AAA+ superfamily ATPase